MIPLSISLIEGATLTAWPAIRQAHDGLWLWRYANGYTKRANSIHCLDPSDGAYARDRIARMAELSVRHSIPPVFRVTPLTAPSIIAQLDRLGWEEFDHSLVMAMENPAEDFVIDTPVKLFDPADPEWYKAQSQMAGYDAPTVEALRTILELIPCESCGVLVYHKAGLPVAATLATVASGIGIYLNVVTHPSARGMGYGRAAVSAAVNWVRSMGAHHSALQVLAGNDPAIRLYSSLGFGEVYPYAYRRAPGWAPA